MPLCLAAFGSVRTKVRRTSASWAPDVHTFCPLTTKSSPSTPETRLAHGAQRRQVRAGTRLAHSQRGRHLGPQDRHRPPTLLFRRAERDQRRGDDADALRVESQVGAPARKFFLMHVLLQQRGVAAAELGRITGHAASRCRTSAAASVAPIRECDCWTVSAPTHRPRRQVLVKERHEIRAEGLDVSVEGQLHGAPGWKKF